MAVGFLAGKRVYLTGATGFIGGRLAEALLARGARVTALVRPTTDASILESKGVAVQRGTITDRESIRPDGHDVLLHAAAWVALGVPKRKEALFVRTNVEGTRNVLEAARRAGVPKAVHVSSVAAFGSTGGITVDETYQRPDRYKSLYERTKTEAHRVAAEYEDLAVALAMPGVVVGGGNGPFDAIFGMWARGRLPVLPVGDGKTGWVHLDDTVDGILACAERGRGPYLLVDRNLDLRELFSELSARTNIPMPRFRVPVGVVGAAATVNEVLMRLARRPAPFGRELARGLKADMRYDSAKARKELGWQPDLFGKLARDVLAQRQ